MKTCQVLGNKFTRLIALKEVSRDRKMVKILCLCSCGKQIITTQCSLVTGNTKSCGCYAMDILRLRSTTHGMYGTRPYRIWYGIKNRCLNPNYTQFHYYGGRGITIPDKWKKFVGFWDDMKEGYNDNLQIDRTNNDLGYSKENCRWVTPRENCINKRNGLKNRKDTVDKN